MISIAIDILVDGLVDEQMVFNVDCGGISRKIRYFQTGQRFFV